MRQTQAICVIVSPSKRPYRKLVLRTHLHKPTPLAPSAQWILVLMRPMFPHGSIPCRSLIQRLKFNCSNVYIYICITGEDGIEKFHNTDLVCNHGDQSFIRDILKTSERRLFSKDAIKWWSYAQTSTLTTPIPHLPPKPYLCFICGSSDVFDFAGSCSSVSTGRKCCRRIHV